MENELITVIIPVYKVEKYLVKCIESVIEQTYPYIEIILIDDGSPDNCGNICDEYASKDKRIKVIHKENGGLSDARNKGLDILKGKYVFFLDSDDYINNDTINYLYKLICENEADIAVGMYNLVSEKNAINSYSNKKIENNNIKVYNTEKALETMLYNTEFTNNACNKLFKSSLFSDIRFPVGKLYEDLGTTYKLISNAKKVVLGNKETYNYLVDRTGSIMNKSFDTSRMQALNFAEDILIFTEKNYPNIKKSAIARLYIECIHILLIIPNTKEYKDENNRLKNYLRKYRFTVLLDKKMPKKSKMLCIVTMFGRYILRIGWKIKENLKYSNRSEK